MTDVNHVIRAATAKLKDAGVDNPAFDARLLAAHVLNSNRAQLLSQADRILSEAEIAKFNSLITRRTRREPIGRILGEREFWGLTFQLNEATLEPRPDSETLVEAAIKRVRGSGVGDRKATDALRILDLGAGSGCLLLALLHEMPQATGLGIDCAPRAVEQARANAERLGLTQRAEFRTNDWASGIEEKFDLIVSNPPYIARGEIDTLMPEVREHDPHIALDGGEDGLDVYRQIIPLLSKLMEAQGFALFEVGERQAPMVEEILRANDFINIIRHCDLNGLERVVAARFSTG